MKVREGFVSNSSSTSFLITNTSDVKRTLVEFVKENPQLIEKYCEEYGWEDISQYSLLFSASENDKIWEPGEIKNCIFGDEQDTLIGRVFDYILREGGKSENFSWHFNEWHR